MYAPFSIHQAIRSGKKGAVIYTLKTLFYYRERKQRIMAFRKFIHSYIEPFCKPYSCNEKYDVIIYGSDQIWRKQPGLKYRFNPVYFAGNILMADKHVSYAASMGIIDLCSEDYTFLKEKLSHFTKISVREKSLQDVIQHIGLESQVVFGSYSFVVRQ